MEDLASVEVASQVSNTLLCGDSDGTVGKGRASHSLQTGASPF